MVWLQFRSVSANDIFPAETLFADTVPKLADQKQETEHIERDVQFVSVSANKLYAADTVSVNIVKLFCHPCIISSSHHLFLLMLLSVSLLVDSASSSLSFSVRVPSLIVWFACSYI